VFWTSTSKGKLRSNNDPFIHIESKTKKQQQNIENHWNNFWEKKHTELDEAPSETHPIFKQPTLLSASKSKVVKLEMQLKQRIAAEQQLMREYQHNCFGDNNVVESQLPPKLQLERKTESVLESPEQKDQNWQTAGSDSAGCSKTISKCRTKVKISPVDINGNPILPDTDNSEDNTIMQHVTASASISLWPNLGGPTVFEAAKTRSQFDPPQNQSGPLSCTARP
jgi:hypothetical protein